MNITSTNRFDTETSDQVIGYICKTYNYSKFHFDKLNRIVNENSVNKLAKAIQEGNAKVQPIQVDSHFNIVDGQHRFAALKKLRLPIVYYVDRLSYGMDAAVQNSEQRHWKLTDYIESYKRSGNKNYAKLQKLMDEYKGIVSMSTIIAIAGGYKDTSGFVSKVVKQGKFVFVNEQASDFLDYSVDVRKKIGATQGKLRRNFSVSLYQIWSHKGIDKKRLFNILTPEFYRTLPTGTNDINQAIIDKYNYRLHEKIQYVLKNGVFHFS